MGGLERQLFVTGTGLEYCKPKGLRTRRGNLWDPNSVVAIFLAFPIAFAQSLGMSQLQRLTKKEEKLFPQGDYPTRQQREGAREGAALSVWVLDCERPVYLGPKPPQFLGGFEFPRLSDL